LSARSSPLTPQSSPISAQSPQIAKIIFVMQISINVQFLLNNWQKRLFKRQVKTND
jgi:hypothetical protein